MPDISKDTAYLMRADLYKTVLTLDLAILAGIVTLLQIITNKGPLIVLAYIAIFCLTISAICAIAALEALAAITSPEFISTGFLDRFLTPKTPKAVIWFDKATGAFLGIGLLTIAVFVTTNF